MGIVGFLHTADAHVESFVTLVRAVDASTTVVTVVDAELLATARLRGTDAVLDGIERAIDELVAVGASSIVCTCSTIGAAAEAVGRRIGVDVVRVDRAMAELVASIGGQVVVLAALDSTIAPTVELLSHAMSDAGTTADVSAIVVDGAWDCFEAGDVGGYQRLVADAIERIDDSVTVVVLAQASMAPAADIAHTDVPVVSSPRLAVERLLT